MPHFLDLSPISAAELRGMIEAARKFKAERGRGIHGDRLKNYALAMIFEKNSTRTRVSFEVAMIELGGRAIVLNSDDLQLGRGETIEDTARVLSRYVDAILYRGEHDKLTKLAENSVMPVINGLTEFSHPCQILADVMTIEEHRGPIEGKKIAWLGDGNNVAKSWIDAAVKFGCRLTLACPKELSPDETLLSGAVKLVRNPEEAADGADVIITDTWVSMGDAQSEQRMQLLSTYQVNASLMKRAKPDALFLHCLPAHRGEEVTAEVIDGPQSVVFDEAENRLHVQKAILCWCLGR